MEGSGELKNEVYPGLYIIVGNRLSHCEMIR